MNPPYTQSAVEDTPDSLLERAIHAHQAGDAAAARILCERALATDAGHVGALNNLGVALKALGRYSEAIERFDAALKIDPALADARFNLANTLSLLGRHGEALPHYEHALAANPRGAGVLNNYGNALMALGQHAEAIDRFSAALASEPANAEIHANCGNALAALNRHAEALGRYLDAIALRPDSAEIHVNLGVALQRLGRFDEAAAAWRKAVSLRAGFAEPYVNLGSMLMAQGRHDEAIAQLDFALELQPGLAQAQWNKSLALLALGRFREAWPLYESRWRSGLAIPIPVCPQPLWLGEASLAGHTLLIQFEQGLGDAILMLRYVPVLENLGARCMIQSPGVLRPLLQRSFPRASVVERDRCPDEARFRIPLMSLPLAMKLVSETDIPATIPYLTADAAKTNGWARRLSASSKRTKRTIGLAWRGNPKYAEDRDRSMRLETLLPLLQRTDLQFFPLHHDLTQAELCLLSRLDNTTLLKKGEDSFDDMAALVSVLDMVVSVDSAPAQLAGALGKPLRVLLPFSANWIWQRARSDCPWYRTARLFRQKSAGDWAGVVEALCASLTENPEAIE